MNESIEKVSPIDLEDGRLRCALLVKTMSKRMNGQFISVSDRVWSMYHDDLPKCGSLFLIFLI